MSPLKENVSGICLVAQRPSSQIHFPQCTSYILHRFRVGLARKNTDSGLRVSGWNGETSLLNYITEQMISVFDLVSYVCLSSSPTRLCVYLCVSIYLPADVCVQKPEVPAGVFLNNSLPFFGVSISC